MDSAAGRRLTSYALVLAGALAFGYTLGERLPGHNHAGAHTHPVIAAQLSPEPDGAYTLRGQDGRVIPAFEIVHEQPVHLFFVRPDLSELVHVHPQPSPTGEFAVVPPDGARWEAVAEATPRGAQTVVVGKTSFGPPEPSATGTVPGAQPPDEPADSVRSGADTVTVRIDRDLLRFDAPAPVEDYLGAPAHLVAFRSGDRAFAHLHPTRVDAHTLRFVPGELPAGRSRLFVQVTYHGEVLTFALWVTR